MNCESEREEKECEDKPELSITESVEFVPLLRRRNDRVLFCLRVTKIFSLCFVGNSDIRRKGNNINRE